MDFARFMSSSAGRLLRVVAGIALIIVGMAAVQGMSGILLSIIGLVPLLSVIGNFRVSAPLFGEPFFAKNLQPKLVPVKVVYSEPPHRRYY